MLTRGSLLKGFYDSLGLLKKKKRVEEKYTLCAGHGGPGNCTSLTTRKRPD